MIAVTDEKLIPVQLIRINEYADAAAQLRSVILRCVRFKHLFAGVGT